MDKVIRIKLPEEQNNTDLIMVLEEFENIVKGGKFTDHSQSSVVSYLNGMLHYTPCTYQIFDFKKFLDFFKRDLLFKDQYYYIYLDCK